MGCTRAQLCSAFSHCGTQCHTFAVSGTLKGYDQLLNLVLDETVEYLRGGCMCCSGVGVLLPARERPWKHVV